MKTLTPAQSLFYLRATAKFGWSRNVLLNQLKAGASIKPVPASTPQKLQAPPADAKPAAKKAG